MENEFVKECVESVPIALRDGHSLLSLLIKSAADSGPSPCRRARGATRERRLPAIPLPSPSRQHTTQQSAPPVSPSPRADSWPDHTHRDSPSRQESLGKESF